MCLETILDKFPISLIQFPRCVFSFFSLFLPWMGWWGILGPRICRATQTNRRSKCVDTSSSKAGVSEKISKSQLTGKITRLPSPLPPASCLSVLLLPDCYGGTNKTLFRGSSVNLTPIFLPTQAQTDIPQNAYSIVASVFCIIAE
jgi:hypothetical protein